MDTQQIEQQMRVRRAAIDAKLDLIANRVQTVRRQVLPAVIAGLAIIAAVSSWAYRRHIVRRRTRPSLQRVNLRKAG